MAQEYSRIIKELKRVKEKEPLARYTTYNIGGPADLFYEAKTTEELVKAVKLARELGIPFFLLGGGSNVLISDEGFRGLVIRTGNRYFRVEGMKIVAESGALLFQLIEAAIESSLTGLEFAVDIPGTIGGAVRGNTGAWREDMGQRVLRVQVLTKDNQIKWLSRKECQFAYRQSGLKKKGMIILRVELGLKKGRQKAIRKKIRTNRQKREDQPKRPSAGCIFVNPKPDSAGRMIEECGLKGEKIGGAQISPQHANFFVNLGKAKAEDVIALIKLAKKKVKEKFQVDLEEEINLIGFAKI